MSRSLCVAALIVAGASGCASSAPVKDLEIVDPIVQQWNHLQFSFVADGNEGLCEIWYHPSRVYLGPESATADSLPVFEGGFHVGGQNLPDDVLRQGSESTTFTVLGGIKHRLMRHDWDFAKINKCIYRVEAKENRAGVLGKLEDLIAADTLLYCAYVPRVEVHQHFHGSWHKLSRFAVRDLHMAFHLAPDDTIRLRISTAAMKAVYYPNRVVIEKAEPKELEGLSLRLFRLQEGYWPWKAKGRFFSEFRDTTLIVGAPFEYHYVADPSGLYTLGIVVERDGRPLTSEQILNFEGPCLYVNDAYAPDISTWPLVPTPNEVLSDSCLADLGYPGGKIYPRWAVEKCLELGSGFSNYDQINYEAHKDFIDLWLEQFGERAKK